MSTRDARRLSPSAQAELRRRAVVLVGEGRSQGEVARLLVVSRQSVNEWVAAHRTGGDAALAARVRGRKAGERTALSGWQQAQIAKAISRKNPDQLELPGLLWARALVCEVVKRRFGVRISEKTAGRYLCAWGFGAQKPARRGLEQDPAAVGRWLRVDYPAVAQRARRERARILWADVCSDRSSRGSWAPLGQTPPVEGTGQRFGAGVVSAISNQGHLQFMVFEHRFVAKVFIEFLTRLVHQAAGRKVILILDGHPVHRAAAVERWVKAHPEAIELVYLTARSPELSPSKLLDQNVNSERARPRRPSGQQGLIDDARAWQTPRD